MAEMEPRMSYERASSGVYLLKRRAPRKCADHYGVGVDGNWVMRLSKTYPVVVHLTPASLEIERWHETEWVKVEVAPDPRAALDRLSTATQRQRWDLFTNNCEQFAREVVSGKRESRQLQGVGIGLAALAVVALGSRR
jgi:hypothetical protein